MWICRSEKRRVKKSKIDPMQRGNVGKGVAAGGLNDAVGR